MKSCSNCGKLHSDNATVCEDDGNPLVPVKAQKSTRSFDHGKTDSRLTASQVLSSIGFTILSTLCGVGLANIALGIIAACMPHVKDKWYGLNYVADHRSYLLVGGVIGLFAGLAVSLKIAKTDHTTKTKIETKYIGRVGRIKIYLGAPFFLAVILLCLFGEKLRFGTTMGTYLGLGLFLAVIAVSLYLYDRIPPKWIVPIGIIGWLLTVALAVGYAFVKHSI